MPLFLKNKWFWVIGFLSLILVLACLERLEELEQRQAPKPIKKSPILVEVTPAEKGPISQWVLAEGTIRALRKTSLQFETQGKVLFMAKDKDGQLIREGSLVYGPKGNEKHGQLLLSLDKRDQIQALKQAESELIDAKEQHASYKIELKKAQNDLELTSLQYGRSKKLFAKKAISLNDLQEKRNGFLNAQQEVNRAESYSKAAFAGIQAARAAMNKAQTDVERTSIFAPFEGVVARLNLKTNDYFQPEQIDNATQTSLLATAPLTIIDLKEMEVTLNIPYYEAYLIKPGQKALVSLGDIEWHKNPSQSQQKAIKGTVFSISPLLNPKQRTMRVKVRLKQKDIQLLDGMFVSCWIEVKHTPQALLAPLTSLLFEDDKAYVFVAQNGKAQKRSLELGLFDEKQAQVLKGISQGELLVTKGRRLLHSGMPVKCLSLKKGAQAK